MGNYLLNMDVLIMNYSKLLLLSTLIFGLSACSLSENDEPRNLTISNINTGPVVEIEQSGSLDVFYTLEVSGLTNVDVDVHFYIVHNDELDNNVSVEHEQEVDEVHHLGVVTLSDLTEGSHSLSLSVNLPNDILGGSYQIIAHVDPDNTVVEDIEEDNAPNATYSLYSKGQYPHADIIVDEQSQHDYALKSVEFGQSALLLDAPHVDNGTSEHHSDLVGYLVADYEGTQLETATISADINVNGAWQPLHFWSVNTLSYQDSIQHTFNTDLHEQHVGFDLAFEDSLIQQLYSNYNSLSGTDLQIRFTISDPNDEGDHNSENNVVIQSIPLYFFEGHTAQGRSANIKLAQSFDKSYGDKSKFSVGVDLSGQLLIVPVGDPGARITAEGNVEAYFFNAKNVLFNISYDGSAYVSGTNTGYSSSMVIFNNTVFEDESYTTKFEKAWTKSWEEEKVLAKAKFTIGPVPMSVEAGVEGGLGFELVVGYNAELYANGDLFSVNFGAFGRGGVDLAVASAGVQAQFNLIDNVFNLDSTAGFSLISNDNTKPHIYYALELTDEIDVISGKFGLYAETKGIKWCKKLGIPYPCGINTTRYDLWLYQTPSVFSKSWTLYSKDGSVNL